MKTIAGAVKYEKDAPKSFAYGTRTAEGILVKIWIPKELVGKTRPNEIAFGIELPSGKKKKPIDKKGKRKQRDEEEDDEELDDEDDDEG